jgi:L-cystine uptake protein TcyP (sodium:dicarboxylate symporter family)
MNVSLILNIAAFAAILIGLGACVKSNWSLAKRVLLGMVLGIVFGLVLHLIYGNRLRGSASLAVATSSCCR